MARWNLVQLRLADVTDETILHLPLRLAMKANTTPERFGKWAYRASHRLSVVGLSDSTTGKGHHDELFEIQEQENDASG